MALENIQTLWPKFDIPEISSKCKPKEWQHANDDACLHENAMKAMITNTEDKLKNYY